MKAQHYAEEEKGIGKTVYFGAQQAQQYAFVADKVYMRKSERCSHKLRQF